MNFNVDNLITDIKSLPLLALDAFLAKESGNFPIFKMHVRYPWHCFLLAYIGGRIISVFFVLMQ